MLRLSLFGVGSGLSLGTQYTPTLPVRNLEYSEYLRNLPDKQVALCNLLVDIPASLLV